MEGGGWRMRIWISCQRWVKTDWKPSFNGVKGVKGVRFRFALDEASVRVVDYREEEK